MMVPTINSKHTTVLIWWAPPSHAGRNTAQAQCPTGPPSPSAPGGLPECDLHPSLSHSRLPHDAGEGRREKEGKHEPQFLRAMRPPGSLSQQDCSLSGGSLLGCGGRTGDGHFGKACSSDTQPGLVGLWRVRAVCKLCSHISPAHEDP